MAPRGPFYPSIAFVSNLVLHNLRHFSEYLLLVGKEAKDGTDKAVKVFFRPEGGKMGNICLEDKKSSQMNQPNRLKS
jgi:hypothetical protein